jgi:hypothetical protein
VGFLCVDLFVVVLRAVCCGGIDSETKSNRDVHQREGQLESCVPKFSIVYHYVDLFALDFVPFHYDYIKGRKWILKI